MAVAEAVDSLRRHHVEQLGADRAVQHTLGGGAVLKEERQIDHLEFRKHGVDEAGGVGAEIDDAGLKSGHDVGAAAQLADAEHLDFHFAGGALGDVVGEALQYVIDRVGLGIRESELQRVGRCRGPAATSDKGIAMDAAAPVAPICKNLRRSIMVVCS